MYGVPTVNIGTRQQGRFRHTSIVDVPEDAGAIERALASLPRRSPRSLHFGKGDSARRFLAALRDDADSDAHKAALGANADLLALRG